VPESLKEMRLEKGWNKTVASNRVGIERMKYHRIESLRQPPTLLEAINIADTYGIEEIRVLKKFFFDNNVHNVNKAEVN
jgi:DNA-binding XRE family transcriptional regulator